MHLNTQVKPIRARAAGDTPGHRSAPRVSAVHGALPANRYEQGEVTEALAEWLALPAGTRGALELPAGATELTWRSLESIGNISSASVLHVLRDTCRQQPEPGTFGLLLAMGPGFCSELVLLQW